MKRTAFVSLAAIVAAMSASPSIAATGLTASVYHNYWGPTQPADYTFINTNDAFSYSGGSGTSVKDFFGADAAGQALTDPGSVGNIRVDNQGFINIVTDGLYGFNLSADDYGQLLIDGAAVATAPNYYTAGSGSLMLAAGLHSFDLTLIGNGVPNRLSLNITGPGAVSYVTSADTIAGAVPEPATWAMMLMGFGAIGVAMRRRRRASAPKFA